MYLFYFYLTNVFERKFWETWGAKTSVKSVVVEGFETSVKSVKSVVVEELEGLEELKGLEGTWEICEICGCWGFCLSAFVFRQK